MRLGRFLGIDIFVNPYFLALLSLFFVAGVLGRGLIAFGIVLVHELAHAVAAKRLGVTLDEVELLPFGGVARAGSELAVDPVREIYIALAGPASNIAMLALGVAMKNYGLWHNDLGPFFLRCNLLIALVNLLPVLPLDGGRVYRSLLAGKIGIREANYKAASLGQFIGLMLTVAGSIGIWNGYCGLDIPITALFILYASTRERRSAPFLFMQLIMHKKEELSREGFLPATHMVAVESMPLGQLIKPFVPRSFHLITVLDKQYRYKGSVTETAIIDALLEKGAAVTVGSLIEEKR